MMMRTTLPLICLILLRLLTNHAWADTAKEDMSHGLLAYWSLDTNTKEQKGRFVLIPKSERTILVPGVSGSSLQSLEKEGNGILYRQISEAENSDQMTEFTLSS